MKIVEINKYLSCLNRKEKEYLKQYIGGFSTSDDKKKEILSFIRTAINLTKNHEYTHVDVELFAKSYPESIYLFREYFDTHLNNCDNKVLLQNALFERKIGLLIFAPLIVDDESNISKYLEILNTDLKEMKIVLDHYKEIYKVNDKKAKPEDKRKKVAKSIEKSVFNFDISKDKYCKKYKISEEYYDECLKLSDRYDEIINIFKQKEEEVAYLVELFKLIPEYLATGIEIDDDVINFTILDYYYLTEKSPRKFMNICRTNVNENEFHDDIKVLATFFSGNSDLGTSMDKERLVNNSSRYIIGGRVETITEKMADDILSIFDECNIPKKAFLIEIAVKRYLKGQAILPLNELKKREKEKVLINKQ